MNDTIPGNLHVANDVLADMQALNLGGGGLNRGTLAKVGDVDGNRNKPCVRAINFYPAVDEGLGAPSGIVDISR